MNERQLLKADANIRLFFITKQGFFNKNKKTLKLFFNVVVIKTLQLKKLKEKVPYKAETDHEITVRLGWGCKIVVPLEYRQEVFQL